MFFKRPLQQIPLQYLLLFVLAGLSLWHFLKVPGVGLCQALEFLGFLAAAVLLLWSVWRFGLAEMRRYYPAMLILLLPQACLSAASWQAFAALLLLCALYPILFSMYTKAYRPNSGLSCGLLCGLLGLLYAPFAVLILFVYVMLVVRRLVSLRSLLQPFAGMLLVAVYLWSFCFVFDIPFMQFVDSAKAPWHALSMQPLDKPLLPLLSTVISFLLYVVVAYRMLRALYTKNILLRRKCVLLFFLSLFFLLLTLLAPADQTVPLFAFWSVLVMVLCEEEGFMKNRFIYNLMFAFLWGIAIVSCF